MIALLLAAVIAAGTAAPAVLAPPAAAAILVDGGMPDPEPASAATPVAPSVRRELSAVAAPVAEPHGRLHRVWVFRPPRVSRLADRPLRT